MEFEYKVDNCWGNNEAHEEYLNSKGIDGWELIFAYESGGTFITYTFKRNKQIT